MANGETDRIAVILVHGTWGRGVMPHASRGVPRWFAPGSSFREGLLVALLQRQYDVVGIEHVDWSGANSILHRDVAARKLGGRLDALCAAHPSARRVVIGHSHGGNVCLRAFRHMQGPTTGIEVVTIATPFVELLAGLPGGRRASLLIAPVAVIAIVLWGSERLLGPGLWTAPAMVAISPLGAMVFFTSIAWSQARRRKLLSRRLREGSSQAAYRAARVPTLVLRGFDDEASLTLGVGAVAARLSHISTGVAVTIAQLAYVITYVSWLFLGLIGLTFAAFSDQARQLLIAHIVLPVWDVLPPVGIVVGTCALLEGMAPAVFGRELFLTYLDMEVNSNSVPDAGDHVTAATLLPDSGSSSLRHALYLHPDCTEYIAAWLAGRDASTPPLAPL